MRSDSAVRQSGLTKWLHLVRWTISLPKAMKFCSSKIILTAGATSCHRFDRTVDNEVAAFASREAEVAIREGPLFLSTGCAWEVLESSASGTVLLGPSTRRWHILVTTKSRRRPEQALWRASTDIHPSLIPEARQFRLWLPKPHPKCRSGNPELHRSELFLSACPTFLRVDELLSLWWSGTSPAECSTSRGNK